jgi:hypothetical protein
MAKNRLVKFNSELFRTLLYKKHSTIDEFIERLCANYKESEFSLTRQAVQLWLIGRIPCVDSLYAVCCHFDEPIENFLVKI